jgi:hypothetical protein
VDEVWKLFRNLGLTWRCTLYNRNQELEILQTGSDVSVQLARLEVQGRRVFLLYFRDFMSIGIPN